MVEVDQLHNRGYLSRGYGQTLEHAELPYIIVVLNSQLYTHASYTQRDPLAPSSQPGSSFSIDNVQQDLNGPGEHFEGVSCLSSLQIVRLPSSLFRL